MSIRPLVLIESPFQGKGKYIHYARKCMLDSIYRGEAPLAGHLLYPQIISESTERELGIQLHLSWIYTVNIIAFYIDEGVSPGMIQSLNFHQEYNLKPKLEFRSIEGLTLNPSDEFFKAVQS